MEGIPLVSQPGVGEIFDTIVGEVLPVLFEGFDSGLLFGLQKKPTSFIRIARLIYKVTVSQ